MTQPYVSVVMANYNYARFLPEAVASVFAQSWSDWELIIVDDGSTDGSVEVIQPFLRDPRVRLQRVRHLGQPRAKNAGIELCRGELIAFLDADDRWHASKLERQIPLFDDAQVGVAYSRRTLIDESGRPKDYTQPLLYRGRVLDAMFRNNFVCFSSAVVRRRVLEHVGWFNPASDLAIDFDLWLRVAKHYHFDFADEPLVEYRVGHGNLSRRVGERLKTALLMMKRFLHQYGGHDHLDPVQRRLALAETYAHMGIAWRPYDRTNSARWFARAILQRPTHRVAWRGLASLCMPGQMLNGVRKLLGRSTNWDQAYRVAENDPSNG